MNVEEIIPYLSYRLRMWTALMGLVIMGMSVITQDISGLFGGLPIYTILTMITPTFVCETARRLTV